MKALAIEADKIGIKPIMPVTYMRKGKVVTSYRNLLTGRWAKAEEEPEEEREEKP